MATAEGSDSITGRMEDAELAARIRAGDREALQAVVHAYMRQLETRSTAVLSTHPLRREWPLCFAKSKALRPKKFVRFWKWRALT